MSTQLDIRTEPATTSDMGTSQDLAQASTHKVTVSSNGLPGGHLLIRMSSGSIIAA